MLSDPAGLIHRIPELGALASVPSVRRALAGGKPHKVYRAIWWARLLGRFSPSQKATAVTLLEHRRLWLEPISKAPSMHTVNGIGTAIYGKAELQDDGTAIGTHFIVFVFMPLFPLAQYLYINHGNQYRFYGKAPLGPVAYGLRNLFAVGTGAAILTAGWGPMTPRSTQTWSSSTARTSTWSHRLETPGARSPRGCASSSTTWTSMRTRSSCSWKTGPSSSAAPSR